MNVKKTSLTDFAAQSDFFTAAEARGFSRTALRMAVRRGVLSCPSRGIYCRPNVLEDEMMLLQRRFSRGVYSHNSALFLHGLTDRVPLEYSMTFPFGYNTACAKAAGIRASTCVTGLYNEDVEEVQSPGGHPIRCYGMERTLCDILRKRAKSDPQEISAAFRAYVRRADADPSKLIRIARRLSVGGKVGSYLEVLG